MQGSPDIEVLQLVVKILDTAPPRNLHHRCTLSCIAETILSYTQVTSVVEHAINFHQLYHYMQAQEQGNRMKTYRHEHMHVMS